MNRAMSIVWPLTVLLIFAANQAVASIVFFTSVRANTQNAADRQCIVGDCAGCMNDAVMSIPYAPGFGTADDEMCELPCGFVGLSYWLSRQMESDWISYIALGASDGDLRQAIDTCQLDWYNDDHTLFGTKCNGNVGTVRGIYQVGDSFDIGLLEDYLDPNVGPDGQGLDYAHYSGNFDGVRAVAMEFLERGWSPWKTVWVASIHYWMATDDAFGLACAAHSYVCWQSCNSGWECGREHDIDCWIEGYPEWGYDWTEQPTFLFHLYFQLQDLLDITVHSEATSWSTVKELFND